MRRSKRRLIRDYIVRAARLAWEGRRGLRRSQALPRLSAARSFSARIRGLAKYGGSLENRTRILREIVAGIRADGNPIDLGVRLSCFDKVPYRPDPALSQPGKLGPGIPEDFSGCLPYRYGFGVNPDDPDTRSISPRPLAFGRVLLCGELGIKVLNTSAGSPMHYTPHLQRPAVVPAQ